MGNCCALIYNEFGFGGSLFSDKRYSRSLSLFLVNPPFNFRFLDVISRQKCWFPIYGYFFGGSIGDPHKYRWFLFTGHLQLGMVHKNSSRLPRKMVDILHISYMASNKNGVATHFELQLLGSERSHSYCCAYLPCSGKVFFRTWETNRLHEESWSLTRCARGSFG